MASLGRSRPIHRLEIAPVVAPEALEQLDEEIDAGAQARQPIQHRHLHQLIAGATCLRG